MNLQDENELDWQVMASNWSRLVYLHSVALLTVALRAREMFFYSETKGKLPVILESDFHIAFTGDLFYSSLRFGNQLNPFSLF